MRLHCGSSRAQTSPFRDPVRSNSKPASFRKADLHRAVKWYDGHGAVLTAGSLEDALTTSQKRKSVTWAMQEFYGVPQHEYIGRCVSTWI